MCIYIIKMHLFDNYNAEYFTNNYNAESITSVEKMNYHQWAQQNASVGVTCALLLTSHFSMFERYRNCETFCNFYAILFFFVLQNVLSHIRNKSMHRVATLVSSDFYRSMRPYFNRIDIGICAAIIWAFPLNSFHFWTLLFECRFFFNACFF